MTRNEFFALSAGVAILAVFVGGWVGSPKKRQGAGMMLGLLASWAGVIGISLMRGSPETDDEKADARSRSSAGLIVGCLGISAVVGLAYMGTRIKEPLSATVSTMVGYPVSCDLEGWILIGGTRSNLYGCTDLVDDGYVGCFARVGDFVQNVTSEARVIGKAGGAKFPCAERSP